MCSVTTSFRCNMVHCSKTNIADPNVHYVPVSFKMLSEVRRGNKKQVVRAFVSKQCAQWALSNLRPMLLFLPYSFGDSTSIFISHLLKNPDEAIASLPLRPDIIRNYTFNLPAPQPASFVMIGGDNRKYKGFSEAGRTAVIGILH